jgi:hypothetical protein
MGVDDLNGLTIDLYRNPQPAALLEGWSRGLRGQALGPDDPGGMAGQDRNAVLLAKNADRRLKVKIHSEGGRNACSLVDLPDAHTPDTNLLERDDVRIAGCDDLRNSSR